MNRKPGVGAAKWPGWLPFEAALGLAAMLVLWHWVSVAIANEVILPAPVDVFVAWWRLLRADLVDDILASLRHLAVGYVTGTTVGFLLALAAASWRTVEIVIDPFVELLRPISAIAWIPLAILIFGIGDGVPYFLIFYTSAFPIFVNTLAGIKAVDDRLVKAALTLGASRRLIAWRVVLPGALPMILAGARLSLGVAWATLVAAELVGADSGLGWRSFWYQEMFSMNKVVAVTLTIGVLGYALDRLLRLVERALHWAPTTRPLG